MLFKELVDLVLLAVNGGIYSTEAAVLPPEVESYVPAAAHAVMREEIFRLKAEARAESRYGGGRVADVESSWYTTMHLTSLTDPANGLKYVQLPGVLLALPAEHTLESVYPTKNPDNRFTLINGPGSIPFGMDGLMTFAWHDRVGDKSRVYFHGLDGDDAACDVTVRGSMEISSCLDEAFIPIPLGLEERVIAMSINHFRGQRSNPSDQLVDNKDINGQPA